jgi:mono/diheme cytochrome c family protein
MKTILLTGLLLCFGLTGVCRAAGAPEIWKDQCVQCHGADGKGQTPMGKQRKIKDFTDVKVQSELKDEAIVKAIKEGRQTGDGKTLMPPAKNVTDDDIKAMLPIVRGFKS